MINMRLSEAAVATQARLEGADVMFTACSTDSRSLQAGALFIALQGERFDGHAFIAAAREAGATAALVQNDSEYDMPLLKVADTRKAMGYLAGDWRRRFTLPLIAVTGSNGKTTVKEMLSAILSQQSLVLATQGNFNNDIGVPLTLFGLDADHHYAVIEMGANHAGEIAWLTEIAAPTVALITQCAPAHLEGFGSVAGVARAKAEIFSGVQAGGMAVINADDDFSALWREQAMACEQISFALHKEADVVAGNIQMDAARNNSQFLLHTPIGKETLNLPLPGEHNIANALAATACCLALKLPLSLIKSGLENMTAVTGRLQGKTGRCGARIIDDSYNANPASLTAAVKVAAAGPGTAWLVLGDMGELGQAAGDLHYHAGETARTMGIERLYAIGDLSRQAVQGFGLGAQHFTTMDELKATLLAELKAGVTVLIKGSRSMAMEAVVAALQEEGG